MQRLLLSEAFPGVGAFAWSAETAAVWAEDTLEEGADLDWLLTEPLDGVLPEAEAIPEAPGLFLAHFGQLRVFYAKAGVSLGELQSPRGRLSALSRYLKPPSRVVSLGRALGWQPAVKALWPNAELAWFHSWEPGFEPKAWLLKADRIAFPSRAAQAEALDAASPLAALYQSKVEALTVFSRRYRPARWAWRSSEAVAVEKAKAKRRLQAVFGLRIAPKAMLIALFAEPNLPPELFPIVKLLAGGLPKGMQLAIASRDLSMWPMGSAEPRQLGLRADPKGRLLRLMLKGSDLWLSAGRAPGCVDCQLALRFGSLPVLAEGVRREVFEGHDAEGSDDAEGGGLSRCFQVASSRSSAWRQTLCEAYQGFQEPATWAARQRLGLRTETPEGPR